jgi:hypothetical protein
LFRSEEISQEEVKREAKERRDRCGFLFGQRRDRCRGAEWMKIKREKKKAKNRLWSGRWLFVLCY